MSSTQYYRQWLARDRERKAAMKRLVATRRLARQLARQMGRKSATSGGYDAIRQVAASRLGKSLRRTPAKAPARRGRAVEAGREPAWLSEALRRFQSGSPPA